MWLRAKAYLAFGRTLGVSIGGREKVVLAFFARFETDWIPDDLARCCIMFCSDIPHYAI